VLLTIFILILLHRSYKVVEGSCGRCARCAIRSDRHSRQAARVQLFGCSVGGFHRLIWYGGPDCSLSWCSTSKKQSQDAADGKLARDGLHAAVMEGRLRDPGMPDRAPRSGGRFEDGVTCGYSCRERGLSPALGHRPDNTGTCFGMVERIVGTIPPASFASSE